MRRLRGSVSQRRFIFIADTSSTTGAGLANLVHNSSGLVAYYIAGDLSNEVQITLVSGTLGTYVSGGFVAVDNANMPGWYEVGIPDAALDGGNQVAIQYRGATNMAPVNIYIELDAVDYQDAAAFGLSRIDQTIGSRATQTSVDAIDDFVDTEVAAIKAKTDLIVPFPDNFGALGIDPGGAINEVILVYELDAGALTANNAGDPIAGIVWNALTTATYTDQSFGDRILISTNNTRQVAVTGSNHVASVLHDAEPNSIPEDAFVTGSISARAIGTDAIDADALADGATTEIANAVAATQALSRLDSMIESDGAGQFRFDVIALENAPAGGGGGGTDWTANERSAIRSIFGFDSSGNISIPSLGVLDAIKDKTDLITTGTIQSSIPVTIQGQITGPLFIGDDYLSANGRAFQWTVALPSGFVIATSTCRFGMEHAEGATTGASFAVAGTVTDAGGGNVTLSFDVPKATTGTLKAGFYRWSVEIASAGGNEVTRVASDGKKLVEWREKQT
jgi:hypothetical protein